MYIDLNNIQQAAYYGVSGAEQFAELGWEIDFDDTGKCPSYTVYDQNGNDIFTSENIDGLEPWMILECGYHHVAYTRAYVSVHSEGKFKPYKGRYGEGYTITLNNRMSTNYSLKFYYIRKSK